MSEFEISLLRQRAMEARRQKVGRGLVLTQVPVGYVRTEDEGIEKTPIVRFRKLSLASFASFVSWAVCVKFCSGIVTRNC